MLNKKELIKELRDAAGISQADLADRVGLAPTQISRYESAPDNIPVKSAVKILQALGVDSNRAAELLFAQQVENPVNPGAPYSSLEQSLELLERYLFQRPASIDKDSEVRGFVDNILERIRLATGRPKVVFAGAPCSGKSHIINQLLGKSLLPTSYTQTQGIAIYIHHVDQKPKGLQENVFIIERSVGDGRFDMGRLQELEYVEDHTYLRGNAHTLYEYRVSDATEDQDHVALVFDDAAILKACSIIDTPGKSHNSSSHKVFSVEQATREADVLVYTARILSDQGFIQSEDLVCIDSYIKKLPVLSAFDSEIPRLANLFVLATHAGQNIEDSDLDKYIEDAADRLHTVLGETTSNRNQESPSVLRKDVRERIYSYWSETPDRREDFESAIKAILETTLPGIVASVARKELDGARNITLNQLDQRFENYEITKNNIPEMAANFQTFEGLHAEFKKSIADRRKSVVGFINKQQADGESIVQQVWDRVVSAPQIEEMINENFDNTTEGKKNAKKHAIPYVMSQIQDDLSRDLAERSHEIITEIDKYLDGLKSVSFKPGDKSDVVNIPVNVEGAFVGGLAGAVGIGALSFYASSLGSLGSYILVAKGVGALSALGVGLSGGTASVITGVAAIGGPITIAIALGAIAALGGFAFFGSWQRRLSKSIVGHLKKNNVRQQLVDGVTDFWRETEHAFNEGAEEAENKYKEKILYLQKLAKDPEASVISISQKQEELKSVRGLFENMPWY